MPELPTVNAREALAALRRLGFEPTRQTGSHIICVHPPTGRRAVIPSHGGKDTTTATLRRLLKEAQIEAAEFISALR